MKLYYLMAGFFLNSVSSRLYSWIHTGIWPGDTIFPVILLAISITLIIARSMDNNWSIR